MTTKRKPKTDAGVIAAWWRSLSATGRATYHLTPDEIAGALADADRVERATWDAMTEADPDGAIATVVAHMTTPKR